ncbi:MAG: DUF4178 domain-containing protein [Bryobacteraceae bacterium]|nr:DUF4178 domain-containing protein [Bryobacteraceae bacterium]
MSGRRANCPNCGAPVEFRWSSAVQAQCPYCRSILVRHDVDLERVGEYADLPESVSPLQIGSEGVYGGKAFQVVGRVVYEYEDGSWNEWHILFQNGESGWLSDAQAQYAVTRLADAGRPLPNARDLKPGFRLILGGREYVVSVKTEARYAGFEGELPFESWEKDRMLFVDLRTEGRAFATIDYSEEPPLFFAGEWVEFDELRLKNLREFEGW